ncbi:MAG: thioredoxin domain-containing protein [Pseudomonadales bacterium]|nr:thioredoxin domain-containing protein [Pseudomonadales bacterium]
MKSTATIFGALILVSTALSASTIYLYSEVQDLRSSTSSQANLSANDVITLIDNRIATLEKRKAQELLSNLEPQFQLASLSTPSNRLIYGDSNARITLQEFGDIECPFCRKMHSSIKQVVDYSQGVINWEFKHFPLSSHNPVAAIESQAIECVKAAYDNRTAWIALERFMTDTKGNGKGLGNIPEYVRSFGLNGSLISNCLASDDHKRKINQDYEEGLRIGVTATPAILIHDNQLGKEYLLKGYKTSEQLLQAVQQIIPQQ